ncbi:MAG: hypothetical protein WC444_04265 [Candidatus Paceibacterota bacterium]
MIAKYPPLGPLLVDDPLYSKFRIKGEFIDRWVFNEEKALIELLNEGVCFFGSSWDPHKDTSEEGAFLCIGVFLNMNDTFGWATAEGESFDHYDVEDIYRLWKSKGGDGVVEWVCLKRKLQPIRPVKDSMIKAGHWTEELEKLPENGR